MAASAFTDNLGLEFMSESSPNASSSDDLFADINWPEDPVGSPLGDNENPDIGSDDHKNESPKDGTCHLNTPAATPFDSSPSQHADNSPRAPDAAHAPSKSHGGCRFSREARSILRTWFNEHKDNPYPTTDEKNELATKANLKASQISLWLVNARRRYRSRKQLDGRASIAFQGAVLQPNFQNDASDNQAASIEARRHLLRPFEELNPMDRWKVTPMEQEPAATPLILATVAAAPPPSFDPYLVHYRHQVGHQVDRLESDLQSGACLSYIDSSYWGESMASYETGMPSMIGDSSISDSTAFSNGVLNYMPNPHAARDPTRDRRRRRGHTNKISKPSSRDRPFQCTFCEECTFATKHDWQRHEKSQHLTLESWTCCLSGGTLPTPNGPACVFCYQLYPDTQHMETHNYSACQEKELSERTFYRKDHFQQHLRLTHESKFHSRMEAWKAEAPLIRSRCGFCSATFTTWSARADHLAAHFKCRATMKDWVGDLGFEPHIAALVERVAPNLAEAHPKLTKPSMPPPPHSFDRFAKSSVGHSNTYRQPLAKQAFTIDALDGTQNISYGMDPLTVNTGFLDIDNLNVSDWVDFGV